MDWIDLTQTLWEGSDRAGRTRPPSFTQLQTVEHDHFSMMEYTFVSHIGTHIDAPNHFLSGAGGADEIALERVVGSGVVLEASVPALIAITDMRLAAGGPEPRPGDIVLLRTGWEEKMGTADYMRHPYLDVSACRWLVEHQVSLVGMDLITPEQPEASRTGPFDWPAHHALMDNGVLVMENVCNMATLVRRRVEVVAAPIPIRGGDGAPVRVIARPVGSP